MIFFYLYKKDFVQTMDSIDLLPLILMFGPVQIQTKREKRKIISHLYLLV